MTIYRASLIAQLALAALLVASQSPLQAAGMESSPGGIGSIGTQVKSGADGRYIHVRRSDGDSLQIGEIEAFLSGVTPSGAPTMANPVGSPDNANDVALGSKGASATTASGSFVHGADSNLVNGTISTNADSWHRSGNPVIGRIDLGSTMNLGSIRVWQRGDPCCQGRLQNFDVQLLADNGGTPGAVVYESLNNPQVAPDTSFDEFAIPDIYTVAADDTLTIDVNLAAGTADLLSVGADGMGQLTIEPGATLKLNVVGNPLGTGTFDILDFGNVTGSFSSVVGGNGFILNNLLTTGEITRALTPEPSTFILFGVMLGGMGSFYWRRRRR